MGNNRSRAQHGLMLREHGLLAEKARGGKGGALWPRARASKRARLLLGFFSLSSARARAASMLTLLSRRCATSAPKIRCVPGMDYERRAASAIFWRNCKGYNFFHLNSLAVVYGCMETLVVQFWFVIDLWWLKWRISSVCTKVQLANRSYDEVQFRLSTDSGIVYH